MPAQKFDQDRFLNEVASGITKAQACRNQGMQTHSYHYHKKIDPEFKKKLELIDQRKKNDRKYAREGDPRTWKDRFIERYAECNDRLDSAVYAGARPVDVRDALDPAHPAYDEEFRRQYDDIDMELDWKIEDGMRRDAADDNAPMSVRKAALGLQKTELGRASEGVNIDSIGDAGALMFFKERAAERIH